MKEKIYKALRKSGVPFVDAHIIARKLAKCKSKEAFEYASKTTWSKPGSSDYRWNNLDEELYSYSSLILPNGYYLINHSHSGIYVSDKLPLLF